MSSLGAKVKDILHKDRPDDSNTTPHPPGSFPTEDMEPSEIEQGWSKGHEQNKLHKADDPRGWTESEREPSRGHGYKDSGVGMTESDNRTSYKPSQDPMSERRNEPFSERRDDNLNRTSESGALGQKEPLAPSTAEHPYWGDIPSRGGVHNSVIGHGSPEDEERRHKAIHTGATEPTRTSGTLESGTFLSRRDRDEASTNTEPYGGRPSDRQRPDERTSGSHFKEGLAGAGAAGTEPYGGRPNDRQRPDERTSGSHFKEGLAGAGAAGTAAYGAHELNKQHNDNEEARRFDQTTDRSQPEEHKQRAFPLLGKDHKESHQTEKVKEDKHKDKDHDSKLGGLFGRKSSKDETTRVEEQDRDKHHHSKTGPALGAAGAAGAYAATRDRDDDNRRDTTTGKYQEPSAQDTYKEDKKHDSKLGALFHRKGSKDQTESTEDYDKDKHHHSKTGPALAAAGAAGAGGAYAATRNRHDDDNNRRDTTAGAYQDPSAAQHTTKYPAAGLDSTRDYNSQNPSSGGVTQKPYRQEDIDYHRGSGLATGAAAGLGAGALASHHGRRDDDRAATQPMSGYDNQSYDPTATSQSHQQQGYQQQGYQQQGYQQQGSQQQGSQHLHGLSAPAVAGYSDSKERQDAQGAQAANFSHKDPVGQTQQYDSHRGAGLAAGAGAAGLGAGTLASRSGHDRNEHSGLDSNRGFENQSAYPTEGSAMNPSSRSYEQQDSNRGIGFGAGAAAGLGAGALASRSGRDHDERSGLGSNRGFESSNAYSSERSAMNPASQSYEQHDSHRGAGLAGGAAAGLGGGALASHATEHRRENDQFTTGNDQRGFQTGNTGSGLGNTPGMGNTGFDSSNKQSIPGSQHESQPFTERKEEHDHTLMDNANAGKYNKLASGTPSGIAYD
ncbi:hypothetical protein FVEN_g5906 [Fusarium venenatum]|uniref:Uncharacterized protein n=1 Tax=Fusarium venenatum TaxID=56646 RepID=A0A2L2T852_9HYPO|nr:uncharacterized protein FVRRES_05817 [Fusarium venenatum]KAG8356079.1 hypothetical protein FVEN_g5906 [Fusarium venenatum]KAH6992862.1 hypothetical protein EDB82DRAFT_162578 [Fusarium venenatum]CEI61381.1 unnamed protein product [Fusarium venenatum]